jgi:hypothetical protein
VRYCRGDRWLIGMRRPFSMRRPVLSLNPAWAAATACVLPFLRLSMNRLTWRSVMWPPGIRPPSLGGQSNQAAPRPVILIVVRRSS